MDSALGKNVNENSSFSLDNIISDIDDCSSSIDKQLVLTSHILNKSNNILLQIYTNKHMEVSKMKENTKQRFNIKNDLLRQLSEIVGKYTEFSNCTQLAGSSNDHCNNFVSCLTQLSQKKEYLLNAVRKMNALDDIVDQISNNDIEVYQSFE